MRRIKYANDAEKVVSTRMLLAITQLIRTITRYYALSRFIHHEMYEVIRE